MALGTAPLGNLVVLLGWLGEVDAGLVEAADGGVPAEPFHQRRLKLAPGRQSPQLRPYPPHRHVICLERIKT